MILFDHPADPFRFEDAYTAFLAAIERVPGIQRRQVSTVMGSPQGDTPLFRVLEVYFADETAMHAALRSPEGQAAGARLPAFAPTRFQLIFADVYEEAGGSTPHP